MRQLKSAIVMLCSVGLGSSAINSIYAQTIANPLIFTDAERFWADLPTPYVYGPIGCSSDGSVFIYSILETNPYRPITASTPMQLEVIEPAGKVQTFDVTQIDDLQGIAGARSYDVGQHDVDFLFSAIPKKNFGVDPLAQRGNYLARFNRLGQYQGATELVLPGLNPLKLAAFPNGDLLIFASNPKTLEPRLLRFNVLNQQATAYEPDLPFANKNDSLPPPFPKGESHTQKEIDLAQLNAAVSYTQIIHSRDSILLLQMNANAPLFQAYANGSIRAIELPHIDGFTADSLIPSDSLLYVRYRRIGKTSGKEEDALILEINLNSGEEIRRIPPGNFPIWNVACVRSGSIRAIRFKGMHTFQFLTATLQ